MLNKKNRGGRATEDESVNPNDSWGGITASISLGSDAIKKLKEEGANSSQVAAVWRMTGETTSTTEKNYDKEHSCYCKS